MKFGKALRRRALPQWARHYVDYKELKRIIKDVLEKRERPLRFITALAKELVKVDEFYRGKVASLQLSFEAVSARVCEELDSAGSLAHNAALAAELAAGCEEADNLRAYVMLNYLAFVKILKKFDKRLGTASSQLVLAQVRRRPFYCSQVLSRLVTHMQLLASRVSGCPSEHDYTCAICLGLLSNPVTLSCAHRFCWSCLAQAAQFGQCCPVCRKVTDLDPHHFAVDASLQAFLRKTWPERLESRDDKEQDAENEDGESAREECVTLREEDNMEECGDEVAVDAELLSICRDIEEQLQHRSLDLTLGMDKQALSSQKRTSSGFVLRQPEAPRTMELQCFSELLSVVPGSFVVLDIDETLLMTPPRTLLTTPAGVNCFLERINACTSPLPPSVRQDVCRSLQSMLDDKIAVEPCTSSVVRTLQERGCWVIALTSRFSAMAERTHQALLAAGIDLQRSTSPVPPVPGGVDLRNPDLTLQDPTTGAVWSRGVIYTHAKDKGVALNRFLENVVFRGAVLKYNPEGSVHATCSIPLPPTLVFVDDREENVRSVANGLSVCSTLGVGLAALHYTAAKRATRHDADAFIRPLIELQIDVFLSTGSLLSDLEAERRLETTAAMAQAAAMAAQRVAEEAAVNDDATMEVAI